MGFKLYAILLVLVLLVGCATTQEQAPTTQQEKETLEETSEETSPSSQPETETTVDLVKIPNDIKEILGKSTKLKSYTYNYKSPESDLTYRIYIKGKNMKVVLPETNTDEQGKFYNTIFFDTEMKTAQAYCIGYSNCESQLGKAKDLNYPNAYIETPLDWTKKVTEAQFIDERQVEGRDAIHIQTNIGKMTVESFYGFLYHLEDGSKKWKFTDFSFNSVTDSDVNLPE